jgi:hypothetical protein
MYFPTAGEYQMWARVGWILVLLCKMEGRSWTECGWTCESAPEVWCWHAACHAPSYCASVTVHFLLLGKSWLRIFSLLWSCRCGESMSVNCGYQLFSPRWYMGIESRDGIISTKENSSFIYQRSMAVLPAESSRRKEEELAKKITNLALRRIYFILRRVL